MVVNKEWCSLISQIDEEVGKINFMGWKEEKDFSASLEGKLRSLVESLGVSSSFYFVNLHYLSPRRTKEESEQRTVFYIYQHDEISALKGDYEKILSLYDQSLAHFCPLMIKYDWNKKIVFRLIRSKNYSENNSGNFVSIPESVINCLLRIPLDCIPNNFPKEWEEVIQDNTYKDVKKNLEKIKNQLCRSVNCKNLNNCKESDLAKELFGTFNLTLRGLQKKIKIFNELSEIYIVFSPIAINWDNHGDVIAVLVSIPKDKGKMEFNNNLHNIYGCLIRNIHHKELLFIDKHLKMRSELSDMEKKKTKSFRRDK